MTMYVCTKGYYKLPDKDIMLKYGYPFSRSRYRIITQQQSPQTLATGVPSQLDPVHIATNSKQHFNITVPWPSKCSPLSHFCTRFPCQLNIKVLHLTVLQTVRERYHVEGHYETYSPFQFVRPSYTSLLLNYTQLYSQGARYMNFK